jgi:phage major head subunit gpT-like protein
MDISPIALTSLNNGVSTAFNSQLWTAKSFYKMRTFDATSMGDEEVYPRLNMIPGLRKWVGERVVNWLNFNTFKIANETFENTVGVKRENLEDDKYGFLGQFAQQMGRNAANLPDLLTARLMVGGTTAIVDGSANFYDTDHLNYDQNGNQTTNFNYQAAPNGYSGPSWYLHDTSQVLMPYIYQTRRPFGMKALFSPESPDVFWKDEFLWGVDGRANAGYGLWYLSFRSDAPLTVANLEAARTAMAAWRRPDGAPMGITPDVLETGVTLGPTARSYCTNQFLPPTDPLVSGTGTVNNTFMGLAKAVENPWIN